MQVALSFLRPRLSAVSTAALLRLLRSLASGEAHPAGLPLLPDPSWMRALYRRLCTAEASGRFQPVNGGHGGARQQESGGSPNVPSSSTDQKSV